MNFLAWCFAFVRSGDGVPACQFCIGIPGQKGVLENFGAWPFLSVDTHLRHTLCTSACQIGSIEERRRSLLFLMEVENFRIRGVSVTMVFG